MMLPLLAVVLLAPPTVSPVTLGRKFLARQKLAYSVKARLNAESRGGLLETWIPEDVDLSYGFTLTVQKMKADGIAELIYERPTITEVQGETFDAPPKTTVEKLNQKVLLTLSPINEILDVKDLTPKKKNVARPLWGSSAQGAELSQFVGEIQRLCLFVGPFDSSLDLAPRMSLDEVNVGDSWKRTVSYQPQKLKSKGNKQVVQRLDYTFTYKGVVSSNGKSVRRVQATLDLNTDLGEFINQSAELTADDTGIAKIPLKFSASIDFDLDLVSGHTILAVAEGKGEFAIYLTSDKDKAIDEERFRGRTVLNLVGTKILPASK